MGDHVYDREAYRERPVIERTINRLKRHRRIATRYESQAASYPAMITIAMILEWLSLCTHALVPGSPVEIARGRQDRTLR